MPRRNRIPFDPPGHHRKQRRRSSPLRADQLFMTRRMFAAKAAVVGAFATLAAKLGYMQIVQGQQYQLDAENNTQGPQTITPPRGLIYDRAGRELAINERSWQVKVVPGDLPEDAKARRKVLDTLISSLGLPNALVLDPNRVPDGADDTVYRRVAQLVGGSDKWVARMQAAAKINYLVLLQDELTEDEAARFRAAAAELPGVEVMNILDYQIGNLGDPRQPVLAKANVPREIALKLAANQLYLPGVTLDDDVLTRRYTGGDVMSHLLGYVGTISEEDRQNTEFSAAAGYDDNDIVGKNGLERTMEPLLRGKKGVRFVEFDAQGYVVRELPLRSTPAVPGENLKLTIDLELQAAITDFLKNGIQYSNELRKAQGLLVQYDEKTHKESPIDGSGAGTVVVLDPRSGQVLAMVSWPQYDNQLFVDGISQRKFDEYNNDTHHPLTNHAVMDHYPPGSTLKVFMAATALHEKTLTPTTQFTCTGGMMVPDDLDESKGQKFWCWSRGHDFGHGSLDVIGGLEQSCDIFFYNVGAPKQPSGNDFLHYYDINVDSGEVDPEAKHYFSGLGIQRIHQDLKGLFWFGQTTQIDLPWEAPGLVPNEQWLWDNYTVGWSVGDTINASIGQGYFLATPLQVALNTAAVANGGTVYKPMLLRAEVDDGKKTVQAFEPTVLRKMPIAPDDVAVVQAGMRKVVSEEQGTANHSIIDGQEVTKWPNTNPPGEPEIPIAGKTGTAEFGTAVDATGAFVHQHAWFTCFAPFDKPEVVVTVLIEDGGEGSSYAVPVADKALRAYFELAGKRKRGKVLRTDGRPIGRETPGPLPPDKVPSPDSIQSQGDH